MISSTNISLTLFCLIPFSCLLSVTYSHHWRTRQALIDDLIAINDEDNDDDDDDDDDDDAYSQLHSGFFTKTEDLRQLEEQCRC